MANYDGLKGAIQNNYEWDNGQNKIIGPDVEQCLLALINSLGANYQYAGLAKLTPTQTDPGTPDQNVFYIPTEPGIYANFDGLVVSDGEVAIFKYNGTWQKDSTGAASSDSVNKLGQKIDDTAFNNVNTFGPSRVCENKVKLISGKKYRIYFLTRSWDISGVASGVAVAYIDRYLNGSNVQNIFIRRTNSPTVPEYFDFEAQENDYYLIGFRGNENEKVYYYIDVDPVSDDVENLRLTFGEESGKDFVYIWGQTIPSNGWQYVLANFVLKANVNYTIRLIFKESVSNSAFQLYDTNNHVVAERFSINGNGVLIPVVVSSDTTIAYLKMSLNVSGTFVTFLCNVYSGLEKAVSELVEENREIIDGVTNRRTVFVSCNSVPSGGWHNFNTNVVLKAGVEYIFSGYFSEELSASYFLLLDSLGNAICAPNTIGYGAEATFKLEEDVTNPVIRVSLNSQGNDIDFTTAIAINAKSKVVEIPKFQYLYSDYETFNTAVNGAFFAKSLFADRIDATPSNIYGVHESNIYVHNNKIFLVYASNKTDGSEDHSKYNIELTRLSLDGTIENSQSVASVGQTICGSEIVGCQAPFILGVGDDIHIYCDLHIGGGRLQMAHTVYSITNNTFSAWELVSYVDENNDTVNAINPNEQYICPSWFEYSGHNYCTAVFFNGRNCGVAYTDDFKTFNFIARIDAPLIGSGGEITAQYSSQVNKIIVAYRTIHHCPYLFMQQYDVQSASWEEQRFIPDATARPMMFVFDGVLYIANNAPYSRYNVTVWRYMPVGAWSYWGLVEPIEVAKLQIECTYFSFCVYNNEIYMASIQQGLRKIAVSKIPLESFGKQAVNEKLIQLFS